MFDRRVVIAMIVTFLLFAGVSGYITHQLRQAFGDCKGLEGVTEHIWTGEPCLKN